VEELKLERSEIHGAKMAAWYETTQFLVDISVWDHACCLDVQVLEESSDTIVFGEAGSWGNETGLAARLDSFKSWLTETTAS
jgi:hypothetical protein